FCGACGNNRTNRGGFQFAAARLPWFSCTSSGDNSVQFQGLILLSSAESLYKRAVCWFARRKKFSVAQIQAVLNFSVLYQQFLS
ncbi:hypothetical protein AAGO42_26345, partial [Klebsiella pneumoniae]